MHTARPSFVALWLSLALGWSGCVSSPDRTPGPSIDLPSEWTAASDANTRAPEAWLEDLNAPQLHPLVTEALRNNPNLQTTAARFEQSIAEARIAGADLAPHAGLGLNTARQKINTFGPQSTGGVRFENYELNLNVRWELDLWGRLRDGTSAALAEVEARQAELNAARLSLAAQVAKSWLNYSEAYQQVALAEKTARSYQENLQTLETRFRRGLAEGLDLRFIRTQAAAAEADTHTRRRTLDQAARSLEVLLGRYPSAKLDAATDFPSLPTAIPAGLPAELLARRPDLVAAERRLAAMDKEVRAARKELLPRISLTGSTGTASQSLGDLLNGDFSVWSLAANLTQPIFQGGRIRANIDRTQSLREQAAAGYRNAALQAFLEVETTLAAEAFLKNEYAHLARAADEAAAAEAQAWERYRNGTIEFLNVLDIQRTAATTQSRMIALRNALLQNRVDLYLALGGPFTPSS